jgi:hypothetical protein
LEDFALFRDAYPAARRKGGDAARAAFRKAHQKVSLTVMLTALAQHQRSAQWQACAGRFIPSMITWLDEERWIQRLPEPEPPQLSNADQAQRVRSLSPQEQLRRLGVKR